MERERKGKRERGREATREQISALASVQTTGDDAMSAFAFTSSPSLDLKSRNCVVRRKREREREKEKREEKKRRAR